MSSRLETKSQKVLNTSTKVVSSLEKETKFSLDL